MWNLIYLPASRKSCKKTPSLQLRVWRMLPIWNFLMQILLWPRQMCKINSSTPGSLGVFVKVWLSSDHLQTEREREIMGIVSTWEGGGQFSQTSNINIKQNNYSVRQFNGSLASKKGGGGDKGQNSGTRPTKDTFPLVTQPEYCTGLAYNKESRSPPPSPLAPLSRDATVIELAPPACWSLSARRRLCSWLVIVPQKSWHTSREKRQTVRSDRYINNWSRWSC